MSSVLQCMHPQSFNFRSQQYGALVVSELHEESQCLYYCQSVQSSFQNISSAGPQGSVLAHLLFIIFYRDVPRIVSFPCAVFADDTPLLTAALVPATLNTRIYAQLGRPTLVGQV